MNSSRYGLLILLLTALSGKTFGQTFISNFTAIKEIQHVGDKVFFVANDGVHGPELWVTNGSRRNTTMVKDICPGYDGSSPSNLISFKGELYFSAYDNANGTEIWKSDGTSEGTKLIKNINPNVDNYNNGSNPGKFVIFKNELYFTASDIGSSADLWKTDGTNSGTTKVFETHIVGITDLVVVGDYLFMRGYAKVLWKLTANTGAVTKFDIDEYYTLDEINKLNNSLVFITHTSYRKDIRLYTIDPVTDKVTLLREFTQPMYGYQEIDNFTVVKETMFFSVRTDYDSDPATDVLWKTDGTVDGTVPVKSFGWDRHWSNSFMQNFIAYNDALFFRGSNAVNNYLCKSDGTESGTKLVHEVSIDEYVDPIVSNNKLYFASNGSTLWESDGTSSGTTGKYLEIGLSTYTDPTVLADANDVVYFKGKDQYGLALWSNVPNADIEVKQGYKKLVNKDHLTFESKVDSCISYSFEIRNTGDKELPFRR